MKASKGKGLFSLLLMVVMICTMAYPAKAAFTDISGHWSEQDVLKMAAKGIIQGDGAGKFFPEAFVSRQEAIALLVGMVGQQGSAANLAVGDTSKVRTAAGISEWAQGFMLYAFQAGIIAPGEWESSNWAGPAQRQEVAIWLSKAIKLLPVMTDNEQVLGRFLDGKQVNLLQAPYIVPLIQDGIFKGNNGYFYPLQPIKRSEVVVLLSRADARYLAGVVTRSQQGRIASFISWPNPSLTITNALGQSFSYAVNGNTALYKNGKKASVAALTVGESVEYINDGSNQLVYLEASGTGVIPAYPGNSTASPSNGAGVYAPFEMKDGKVRSIDWISGSVEVEVSGKLERYTLAAAMMSEYEDSSSFRRDAPRTGDWAKLTVQNGVAISLRILADDQQEEAVVYKGTLDSVDSSRERITLESGTIYSWTGSAWKHVSGTETFDVDSSADIYYNSDSIDLDELEDYRNRTVYVACASDDFEADLVRVIRGSETTYREDITDLDLSRDEFELENSKTISFDAATIFLTDGELSDEGDLEEDEEVRVCVDRYGSSYNAALVEMGSRSSSSNSSGDNLTVYRATLSDVDEDGEEIDLKSGSIRELDDDGDWRTVSGSLTMDLASSIDFYHGDQDIDLDELYRYEDDTVYLLYDEDAEEVIHLRVREDSERIWSAEIDTLSSSSQRFLLEDGDEYIYWEDDTILIEAGERLDGDDLDEGDELVVILDDDGSNGHAAIILRL